MFKSSAQAPEAPAKSAGEKTQALILQKALELFREQGFAVSTMRDIARAAGVATGAAYYYFPSKEAIVSAYYHQVQRRHAARVREELAGREGLRDRLACVLHRKLEILQDDRKFLGALFRYTGEPGHPLSVFGRGTEAQRKQSLEIFREAIAVTEMTEETKQLLAWALWLFHLGMILFFLHDPSEGQRRTHKLVDRVADLFAGLVALTSSPLVGPMVKPFREKMLGMLREAGWSRELGTTEAKEER
jgi:AcrR family transcriptional regulator